MAFATFSKTIEDMESILPKVENGFLGNVPSTGPPVGLSDTDN